MRTERLKRELIDGGENVQAGLAWARERFPVLIITDYVGRTNCVSLTGRNGDESYDGHGDTLLLALRDLRRTVERAAHPVVDSAADVPHPRLKKGANRWAR